jgi:hypothetical protein
MYPFSPYPKIVPYPPHGVFGLSRAARAAPQSEVAATVGAAFQASYKKHMTSRKRAPASAADDTECDFTADGTIRAAEFRRWDAANRAASAAGKPCDPWWANGNLGMSARIEAAFCGKAAQSAKRPVVSDAELRARFAELLGANMAARRETQTPDRPAPPARPPEQPATESWEAIADQLNRAQAASNPAFRYPGDGRR